MLPSCMYHEHRFGVGPSGTGSESARQIYLFFGLVRFNEVDEQRMAGGLQGYSVETEYSFVDLLLAPFLLPLTMTSRTVTVNK
jgi:Bor protein